MHCMHYCVMLSVIACCVSPFLLNLFLSLTFWFQPQLVLFVLIFLIIWASLFLLSLFLIKKKGINFEEPHISKEIDHLGVRPFKRGHVLKFSYLVQFTKRWYKVRPLACIIESLQSFLHSGDKLAILGVWQQLELLVVHVYSGTSTNFLHQTCSLQVFKVKCKCQHLLHTVRCTRDCLSVSHLYDDHMNYPALFDSSWERISDFISRNFF